MAQGMELLQGMPLDNKPHIKYRDEKLYVAAMCDALDDPILRNRFSNLVYWYIRHAFVNRAGFRLLSVLGSVFSAAIILINELEGRRMIITAISMVSMLASSIIPFVTMQDNWKRYRRTAELLKSEAFLYLNQSGRYNPDVFSDELQGYEDLQEAYARLELLRRRAFATQMEAIACRENPPWLQPKMDMQKPTSIG